MQEKSSQPFFAAKAESAAQGLSQAIISWFREPRSDQGTSTAFLKNFALGSTRGDVNPNNEDVAVVAEIGALQSSPVIVAAVCDGISSLPQGAQCAQAVMATFLAELCFVNVASETIRQAVITSNLLVSKRLPGSGSTLSAVVITQYGAFVVNVGDSRVYRIDKDSNSLFQLTVDDTVEEGMKDLASYGIRAIPGVASRALAQYMGMGDGLIPRVGIVPSIAQGRFIITTDGIHRINTEFLTEVLLHAPNSLDAVKRLVAISKWGKNRDNASIIMAESFGHSHPGSIPGYLRVADSFGQSITLSIRSELSARYYKEKYKGKKKPKEKQLSPNNSPDKATPVIELIPHNPNEALGK